MWFQSFPLQFLIQDNRKTTFEVEEGLVSFGEIIVVVINFVMTNNSCGYEIKRT